MSTNQFLCIFMMIDKLINEMEIKLYDFDKAYETFLEKCEECGVVVKEGRGEFLMDGKPFDLMAAIQNALPLNKLKQE